MPPPAAADAMLTICLWERADLAMTNPDPLWHPDGLTAFDPTPHGPTLPDAHGKGSGGVPTRLSRALGNLLSAAAGTCNALCQVPRACSGNKYLMGSRCP